MSRNNHLNFANFYEVPARFNISVALRMLNPVHPKGLSVVLLRYNGNVRVMFRYHGCIMGGRRETHA